MRYEDEEVIAFDDINPSAPTHILVIPKRHLVSLADAKEGDKELISEAFWRAKVLADELGLSEPGYRISVNNGPGAGQVVPHVHFHLLGEKKA